MLCDIVLLVGLIGVHANSVVIVAVSGDEILIAPGLLFVRSTEL